MKKCIAHILPVLVACCAVGVWLTLQVTADYPAIGEAVSDPVNQVEGVELKIEKPTWSPFKGYSIGWEVTANTQNTFCFVQNGEAPNSFEFLERCIDGQWYRLEYTRDNFPFATIELALGGKAGSALGGSIVQKNACYGTRLEPGTYRVVLEMKAEDGESHYLAAEFNIE